MSEERAKRVREIETELRQDAVAISQRYGRAPVAIIVAGTQEANVPQSITVFANLGEGREGRMRDQLGILQASIQIESISHLLGRRLQEQDNAIAAIAEAVKEVAAHTGASVKL